MDILILGCSNAVNAHLFWRSYYPDANIVNLSKEGVGNYYIYNTLRDNLLDIHPDYVYLQFSGLHRIDLYIDNELHQSGGLNGTNLSGPYGRVFLPLYMEENLNKLRKVSLQHCENAVNLLDKYKINYNYTWYYDIFNCVDSRIQDEGFVTNLPKTLNTDYFFNSFPHSYAKNNNDLNQDGCHFGTSYEDWLGTVLGRSIC